MPPASGSTSTTQPAGPAARNTFDVRPLVGAHFGNPSLMRVESAAVALEGRRLFVGTADGCVREGARLYLLLRACMHACMQRCASCLLGTNPSTQSNHTTSTIFGMGKPQSGASTSSTWIL